ncbi:TIGR03084 family metal-binding protein [Streptacidiphilus rugosus]|uniref:TIGR03084 family metal-binding protein n=1 Tax=Streptacidiphilus rugosus TaxID=405783 RepID=UPI0007C78C43
MADAGPVLKDLGDESESLDAVVARDEVDWSAATPAPGWTIAHQIGHLAWTDARALIAVRTPEAFPEEILRALEGGEDFVGIAAAEQARKPPGRLLAEWRDGRAALLDALAAADPGARFPWYGPPMSVASMATARLMETWAHGQDVRQALGLRSAPTARLRHIARLGVRTRDFAYGVHGLTPPSEEFRVELTAPDGEQWAYGPPDAPQRVTGPALDFCLVVTQRLAPADSALRTHGDDAAAWLLLAQAFAGPRAPAARPAPDAGPRWLQLRLSPADPSSASARLRLRATGRAWEITVCTACAHGLVTNRPVGGARSKTHRRRR